MYVCMYMHTALFILAHRCGDEIHSNSGCFDGVPTRDDDDEDEEDGKKNKNKNNKKHKKAIVSSWLTKKKQIVIIHYLFSSQAKVPCMNCTLYELLTFFPLAAVLLMPFFEVRILPFTLFSHSISCLLIKK